MISDLYSAYNDMIFKIQVLGPVIMGAVIILGVGVVVAILSYFITLYLFKKLKINELIYKLKEKPEENLKKHNKNTKVKKDIIDNIKIDVLVAKSVAVYIMIVFLRISISNLGITEIENFLRDLTNYLPNLFIGVLIGFFGIRFSNFVYSVIYTSLSISKDLSDERTNKIVAYGAKITVLFFTCMVFLDYTKIVSDFIINSIILGFISMVSLAGGLAFGLGGKETAKEIINNLKNKKD